MRFMNHAKRVLLVSVLLWAVLLSACGPSSVNATNTLSAIYTLAAQTVAAQEASSTPPAIDQSLTLTPIDTAIGTNTPAPTNPPTLALALPTSTTAALSGTGCDGSVYISDVTIPDGTAENAGASFVKTWALQNTGSCTWDANYTLTFVSGAQMGGTNASIGASVTPSQQADVSATLTAPTTAGSYTGWWRLANDSGEVFGETVDVVITVGEDATDTSELTDTPADTATNTPTPGYTSTPSNTPAPGYTPTPTNVTQPTATPTPTIQVSTPTPTTAPLPTATGVPTNTSPPTNTSVPTYTPIPTSTSVPTQTP